MTSINKAVAGEPAFNLEAEINQFRAEIGDNPQIIAQEAAANDARVAQEAVVSAFDAGAAEYAELLEGVMLPGFAVLAPAWGVGHPQVKALAAAYGPLLQKYFPDGPSKFGPEIGAALVTVAIMGPLVGKPRHKVEIVQEAANDPVHDQDGGQDGDSPENPEKDAGESALDPGEYGE